MNDDSLLNDNLQRLGRQMNPGDEFVHQVMEQVNTRVTDSVSEPDINPPIRWPIQRSHGWRWAGTAAAGLILTAGLTTRLHSYLRPASAPPDMTATPVRYEKTTSQWEALLERPSTIAGDSPALEYRKQEFDRVQWTDPASHATLEQNVPRGSVSLTVLDKY